LSNRIKVSKAAVLARRGEIAVAPIDLPPVKADQVLLKMRASGVCRSQIRHIAEPPSEPPMLLGHEGAGEAVAVGAAVEHIAVGDFCALTWVARGEPRGRWRAAAGGATLDGRALSGHVFSWSEYVLVWGGYVVKTPADCDADFAAILGCAINTGAGAVLNTANLQRGESALVIGAGGVGLAAVAMCAALGASPIIIADLDERRLEFARRFGATHAVNAAKADLADAAQSICGGVDYAFDNVGDAATLESALRATKSGGGGARNVGGCVVLIGMEADKIALDPDLITLHQRRVAGSLGASDPTRDFEFYASLNREGKLPLERMVTRRYKLADAARACADLEAGDIVGRAVIEF